MERKDKIKYSMLLASKIAFNVIFQIVCYQIFYFKCLMNDFTFYNFFPGSVCQRFFQTLLLHEFFFVNFFCILLLIPNILFVNSFEQFDSNFFYTFYSRTIFQNGFFKVFVVKNLFAFVFYFKSFRNSFKNTPYFFY